uniref:Uncharacterized protein n=1 Tax=Rhizophora mucronata TaxID=61149 RepID=A0A2P2QD19_RHIMU
MQIGIVRIFHSNSRYCKIRIMKTLSG